jgi:Lrp/AsnC family transcriptional regulator, leucine-responsive regulatory protein
MVGDSCAGLGVQSLGGDRLRQAAFARHLASFRRDLEDAMHNSDATGIDDFDRRILALFQHDTRCSAERIGAAVGLSAAAVQRRLKRLREQGVIEAEVAKLAPLALGAAVTLIVTVDIDRETAAELDAFKRRMLACVEVQQCYYVTGAADFILIVLTPDMDSYQRFTERALLSDGNVRSFTTHVALERVKTGVAVPIAERG